MSRIAEQRAASVSLAISQPTTREFASRMLAARCSASRSRFFMNRFVISLLLFAAVVRCALAADSVVVFNEIHYHPATNEAANEWIELHNQMAIDIDLSAWSLTGAVEFKFAEGTIIRGGGYLVIASDPAALRTAAAITNVVGPFSRTAQQFERPDRIARPQRPADGRSRVSRHRQVARRAGWFERNTGEARSELDQRGAGALDIKCACRRNAGGTEFPDFEFGATPFADCVQRALAVRSVGHESRHCVARGRIRTTVPGPDATTRRWFPIGPSTATPTRLAARAER
jgi:hypothetical protein